jgi:hypothetical protein
MPYRDAYLSPFLVSNGGRADLQPRLPTPIGVLSHLVYYLSKQRIILRRDGSVDRTNSQVRTSSTIESQKSPLNQAEQADAAHLLTQRHIS